MAAGIDISDLSTTDRPQDDLYRYANGPWLDRTEIPADKAIYGAFHALWDTAEQDVRTIVEKTAAAEHPAGSEARKIGDLFTSFMDEETIERLGAGPIADQLELVASIKDVDGLVAALGQLELQGVPGVFYYGTDIDAKKSDEYIVYMSQGGISLPDESYYREDSFAAERTAFVEHVARMLELAGIADAGAAAERIMALETRLAAGHWDRVKNRDVTATYNKIDRAALEELTPGVDWAAWLSNAGVPDGRVRFRGRPAARLPHVGRLGPAGDRARALEGMAQLAGRPQCRSAAEPGLRRRELQLLRQDPDRCAGAARAVEARPGRRRVRARRGGRPAVRRRALPAGRQGPDGRAGRQPGRGLPAADRGARLDEPRDPAARPRQAGHLHAEDRLSGQVEGLQRPRDPGRRPGRQRPPLGRGRDGARPGQARPAGRQDRVADDAADGQRVLQPADERDRLPGRHPAAAVLRPRRRRRGQLRRDRRGDRPRDRPRLRRPGLAVRRRRQPQRLVDRRGPRRVRSSARPSWSRSTTCWSPATPPATR